ncbi:hypothetical protein GJU00_01415 [Enterobacteriaceae endosymbiont of Donacia simplex]|nr:hypothetical protein GJU00_01415 [Enterobacteriaceae endosymbiont of Donacia simplex]
MFDISVNLTNKQFKKDIHNVINRAIKNNINGMLLIGCNITDSFNAYKITKKYKNYCWATVGIHPHYANLWNNYTFHKLETLLKKKLL